MAITLTVISSPSLTTSRDLADAVGRELADVQQAVGAGQDLDEGAVRLDAPHRAVVDLADLGHLGEALDDLDGALGRRAASGEAMMTLPSSSTSISQPVSSTIERMVLPPGPMTSRILSFGICIV